jgi:hypothetical protein
VHYEDDEVAVHRIAPAPGQNTAPILALGDPGAGIGVAEVRVRRTWSVSPALEEAWLTVDLTWTALEDLRPARGREAAARAAGAADRTYTCRLALLGPKGEVLAASGEEVISPRYPTSRWPAGVVVGDSYALALDPTTPGGAYRLQIAVREPESGLQVAAGEVPVQLAERAEPLVPALVEIERPAGVTYGGEMRLLGLSTRVDRSTREGGGQLEVDLYWQALVAMQERYKIFVHLVEANPADGSAAIVAQYDAMPRDWSYPTDLWGRGEVFVERIALDLAGTTPGPHDLAVGVYAPERGRLPAVGVDGERLPDDQVELEVREVGE